MGILKQAPARTGTRRRGHVCHANGLFFEHDLPIEANDVDPDTGSLLGFDDDVIVLNFVLDKIGRSDLRVEL